MADTKQEESGRVTLPPYMAYQTLKTFLQNIKPHKLPGRIDRSLLGNFSGSAQAQLITSLRFLGLIDAKGHPTDHLAKLIQAYDTEQWPDVLGALLRKNYGPVFEIDLASASPGQFIERFRNAFPGAENVVRKSMTFFLNAVRETKIEISPHITKNKKPRAAGSVPRRRAGSRPASATHGISTPPVIPERTNVVANSGNGVTPPKAPNAYELLAVFDPSDMNEEEQGAVWTLIQYLKRKEVAARANEQRRQKAVKTAAAAATTETKEATDGTALANP